MRGLSLNSAGITNIFPFLVDYANMNIPYQANILQVGH